MIKQGNESPILKIETFPYLTFTWNGRMCQNPHSVKKRPSFVQILQNFCHFRHGQLMGCKFYFFGQEQWLPRSQRKWLITATILVEGAMFQLNVTQLKSCHRYYVKYFSVKFERSPHATRQIEATWSVFNVWRHWSKKCICHMSKEYLDSWA